VLFVHSDPELKERRKILINREPGLIQITIYFRTPHTGIAPLDRLLTGLRYYFAQSIAYRELKTEMGKPDIVHVHVLLRSCLFALSLKRKHKIPFVITEHWSGFDPTSNYSIGRLKRVCIKNVLPQAAAITTVSEYLKSHMLPYHAKGNFEVVSNAVDENLFNVREKISPNSKKKLVHISTLDDYPKNFGQILRTIAAVHQHRNDFELHVIGKGVEREKQERLALELGVLNTVVFFHGYLPKSEVAEFLAGCDLLVMFSLYETQSCVALEALMSGVPVIAPDLCGIRELITKDNGFLVEPNNSPELERTINSFLDNQEVFSSASIRENALKYGYSRVGRQFGDIYTRVLNLGK